MHACVDIALPGFGKTWVSKLLKRNNKFSRQDHEVYSGICKLDGDGYKHHQIDLIIYEMKTLGFAVFAWTGDKDLNRVLRKYSEKKLGLQLSDTGLCPCKRVPGGKLILGPSIKCDNDEEIFKALRLPYIPLCQRETIPTYLMDFEGDGIQNRFPKDGIGRNSNTNGENITESKNDSMDQKPKADALVGDSRSDFGSNSAIT